MRKKIYTIAIALMALGCSTAAPSNAFADRLNFAIGYYDVFDKQDGIDFRVEYRSDSIIFTENLKPWGGVEITSQGSLWGGGGLLYDLNISDKWYLTPSLGAGLYTNGGSDKDLDYPLQFRSQLELAYEFKTDARIGLSFSHMSNAGLGDKNPGTEVLSLNWSLPF